MKLQPLLVSPFVPSVIPPVSKMVTKTCSAKTNDERNDRARSKNNDCKVTPLLLRPHLVFAPLSEYRQKGALLCVPAWVKAESRNAWFFVRRTLSSPSNHRRIRRGGREVHCTTNAIHSLFIHFIVFVCMCAARCRGVGAEGRDLRGRGFSSNLNGGNRVLIMSCFVFIEL